MIHNSAATDWSLTRERIYQRFLGRLPRHKREPLDLVDLIHHQFPQWTWMDIARWMDGSKTPTAQQHAKLLQWEQALNAPLRSSSSLDLAPGDRVLELIGQEL